MMLRGQLRIFVAQFPFLDSAETKLRPVIVMSEPQGKYNIVAVIPVSSKQQHEKVDILLSGWEVEGLLVPSVARVHRITTMLQSDLLTELGRLNTADTQSLRAALRNYLNL